MKHCQSQVDNLTMALYLTKQGHHQKLQDARLECQKRGGDLAVIQDKTENDILRKQIVDGFGQDARQLKRAMFVPLGGKVTEGLQFLVSQGVIEERQILGQLPHPSHASAERVAALGIASERGRAVKLNLTGDKLDMARTAMMSRMAGLITA